jgi:hypothetical protein
MTRCRMIFCLLDESGARFNGFAKMTTKEISVPAVFRRVAGLIWDRMP